MITIEGMGWVTPLGRSLSGVWRQIAAEARPPLASQENPVNAHPAPIYRVPDNDVAEAAAHPRLRRSSRISHLALTAARDAISGLSPELLARTVLVFVASDGGVIYTRRFYADIVERGGGAGSPILFPETVYNAPASHVAAVLGLDAEVLTLVGDAATGIDGIATATEFLTLGEADRCLVVAAQELDCGSRRNSWMPMARSWDAARFSPRAPPPCSSRATETDPSSPFRRPCFTPGSPAAWTV